MTRLLAACAFLPAVCSREVGEQTERTGRAPKWTEDPPRTSPSPGIRAPLCGYTYGQPSGNRVAQGRGRLPVKPVEFEAPPSGYDVGDEGVL